MRTAQSFAACLVGLLAAATAAFSAQGTPAELTLIVKETPSRFELTVPVSKLTMSIPKEGWQEAADQAVGGSTESPRYFRFESHENNLVASGWFESAAGFTSLQKLWESEVAAWRKGGLPLPEDVAFTQLAGWDAVRYEMPIPEGSHCHLRAQWVQAGTWIDLHLSAFGNVPSELLQADLERLLAEIKVTEKK